MAKLLLIIAICSIVYSDNWRKFYSIFRKLDFTVPVFINFTFFSLAIFSIITYAQCYKRVQPVLVLPMLTHLVRIFLSLTGTFWNNEKTEEKLPKNGFKNSLEPFNWNVARFETFYQKTSGISWFSGTKLQIRNRWPRNCWSETIELLIEMTTHKTMFE